MNVRGRDPATECYVVEVEVEGRTVRALVPERLSHDLQLVGARPSHQTAYVWMAENKKHIVAAITTLVRGPRRPKAPYDQITLIEER